MSQIQYLNTDLAIESEEDLSPIVEYFGEDMVVLFHGEAMSHRHAYFEIASLTSDADTAINHFCRFAESLPERARVIWDHCSKKIFNIGYRGGTDPPTFGSEIRSCTVKRVAALGASILVTIYPASNNADAAASNS